MVKGVKVSRKGSQKLGGQKPATAFNCGMKIAVRKGKWAQRPDEQGGEQAARAQLGNQGAESAQPLKAAHDVLGLVEKAKQNERLGKQSRFRRKNDKLKREGFSPMGQRPALTGRQEGRGNGF